jgi:outer membrane protein assembly factor BamA
VRGYGSGALFGNRVIAGSAEYRAPLVGLYSGIGRLPVFLDRAALALFADAATVWCTRENTTGSCFTSERVGRDWIGSIGADLGIAIAFPYDFPFTLHVGYAYPLENARQTNADRGVFVRLGVGHF